MVKTVTARLNVMFWAQIRRTMPRKALESAEPSMRWCRILIIGTLVGFGALATSPSTKADETLVLESIGYLENESVCGFFK